MGDQTYTLNEAAQLTGLTVDALRQRIKRRKLQAVRGNDGLIRVRLTGLVAQANETSQAAESLHSRLSRHDQTGDQVDPPSERTIRALEGEAAALRDALDRERTRADGAEAREAEARDLVEHRGNELARQGKELTAALLRTAIAETEARGLREALELARRPAWRRWLGR